MQFFGYAIEQANNVAELKGTKVPRNLFELLPDTFTLEDAKRICRQEGKDVVRAAKMIATWKCRKYIFQISDFRFQKAK